MTPQPLLDVDDDVELLVPEMEIVPEDDLHRRFVDMIAAGLEAHFSEDPEVVVCCRLAWFPNRDDTRIRLDPDVMVVRGRPKRRRRSYKAWVEEDVPPSVLIEVWSPEDTHATYRRRLERAHRYGVAEVVMVLPEAVGGARVEHLVADDEDFRIVAATSRGDDLLHVPSLGVSFAAGDDIAVFTQGSRWLSTAEAALEAAEVHTQRERAQAARKRAERLAAHLRAAGIEPDA